MLILYILFKIKEISFKKYIQKKEAILKVQNKMIKLEQNYFKCLYNGDFSGKSLINNSLNGITNFLDNVYAAENLRFTKVSIKGLVDIFHEYLTLSSNAKKVFDDYQYLLNDLYKNIHPVKYKLETYKKNMGMRILYIFILICNLFNNYGEISKYMSSVFTYNKDIYSSRNNIPIVFTRR